MPLFRKLRLYLLTIRHLKVEQIVYRIYYRLVRPAIGGKASVTVHPRSTRAPFPAFEQGGWKGGDRFRFLNVEHDTSNAADWNRHEWGKLWLYNLHYFDFLRQPEVPEAEGNRRIARWIAENPPGEGNGWEPYPLSLRVANWIKWHISGHPLTPEAQASLALQARCIDRLQERHLLANHFLANAKALVMAGLFFDGPEAQKWLTDGCGIYRRELPEQILPDGMHFERSPMYHSIILEDLLDLVNLDAPLALRETVTRMLHALAAMTGPDGEIARFNDAANGISLAPTRLFDYAEQLGFERPAAVTASCDLPNAGYARLSAGAWTAICDGGAIGPDYQPGHAHADTLSFELWHEGTRLLIDSATGEYIDTPIRREQRGTAGHNTLTLDGKNSSEVWGAHRVAKRARIVRRAFAPERFLAAHNGYAPVVHEREWHLAADKVDVFDRLSGKGEHTVDMYWHFPPESRVTLQADEAIAELGGKRFSLSLIPGMTYEIVTGHYSPEFGLWPDMPVLHGRYRGSLPLQMTTSIQRKE